MKNFLIKIGWKTRRGKWILGEVFIDIAAVLLVTIVLIFLFTTK